MDALGRPGSICASSTPRTTRALGFTLIGYACFSAPSGLIAQWGSGDWIPRAFGQSLALTSRVAYNLCLLRPEDAVTFGTIICLGIILFLRHAPAPR